MSILAVLLAAVANFAVGAVWYGVFSKPWIAASGVPVDADGNPSESQNPKLYAGAFLCILVVTGMMRHMFAMAGIDTLLKGVMAGLGVGLFFIAPWIMLNVLFSQRPKMLAVIDGGYATVGCMVGGIVLTLL